MLNALLLASSLIATPPTFSPASATDPVTVLQALIQTPTVNPPGNESALTVPLFELFKKASMKAELVGASKERLNLVVRIPGRTNAKPILVLAHIDTVLADANEWEVAPFAGKISEGIIWGRGALDNKGMAAALVSALLHLHTLGEKPDVGITAVFTVDEETGSALGIEWLFKNRPDIFDVSFVINEGGFVLTDPAGPAKKTYYVSVGEKGIAWLRLKATGTPGHGSIRWGDNANEKLRDAVQKITSWHHPRIATTPMGQFAMADLRKKGQKARSVKEALARHPIGQVIESDPKLALRHAAEALGGAKPNVIPASAEATIDCRVAPGTTPEEFLTDVKKRISGTGVEVELIARSNPNLSEWQTPIFNAIERAAHRIDEDAMVVPVLAAGATDSRFFRYRGVPSYGIVPIPVPPPFVQGMHGVNERVPVAGVREAETFFLYFLRDAAGFPEPRE